MEISPVHERLLICWSANLSPTSAKSMYSVSLKKNSMARKLMLPGFLTLLSWHQQGFRRPSAQNSIKMWWTSAHSEAQWLRIESASPDRATSLLSANSVCPRGALSSWDLRFSTNASQVATSKSSPCITAACCAAVSMSNLFSFNTLTLSSGCDKRFLGRSNNYQNQHAWHRPMFKEII